MSIVARTLISGQSTNGIFDPEDLRFGDLGACFVAGAKSIMEGIAVTEVEARVGCRLHERTVGRQDYRNGFRERGVQTTFATIRIRVPRMRGAGYVPCFLKPGHLATMEVEQWVASSFLSGLSRIDIIRCMENAAGVRPSDRVITQVQQVLDKQAKEFKNLPITEDYEYLFLDAAWVKDIVGSKAGRICVLTAVGVTRNGQKRILGFERAKLENAAAWTGFLRRLVERGFRVSSLALVISDEHEGILKAVPEALGDVAHQLCWAHRVRNVVKAVGKTNQSEVVKSLRDIYKAKSKSEAAKAADAFKKRWSAQYPTVVASVLQDLRYLLAFFDCPQLHRQYVRTTNPIERVFRDLRRRRYGCGAFANTLACDRVLFSVFRLLNELWEGKDLWEQRRLAAYRRALRQKAHSAADAPLGTEASGTRGEALAIA